MASDSRETAENVIVTNKSQKIIPLKWGALLGLAGDADARDLITLFDKMNPDKFPTIQKIISLGLDTHCLLACPDGAVYTISSGVDEGKPFAQILQIKEPFIAVGSGSKWAMGAMDRGATAAQAVKTAIKYDNQCGGKVQVYELTYKSNE